MIKTKNEPYQCDKCHKDMEKGKALWTKKIAGKLLMVCLSCKVNAEKNEKA